MSLSREDKVARPERVALFEGCSGEVIDQQPRTASVVADGPTTCLALASWDLLALLQRDHRLALDPLRSRAARLRRADEQLRD